MSMQSVVIRSYPQGPRVWVGGQRIHHGTSGIGLALLFLTLKRRRLALAALALPLHDRKDWRIWFAREGVPNEV